MLRERVREYIGCARGTAHMIRVVSAYYYVCVAGAGYGEGIRRMSRVCVACVVCVAYALRVQDTESASQEIFFCTHIYTILEII